MSSRRLNTMYDRFVLFTSVLCIVIGGYLVFQQVHNGNLAQATCHRSVKYGPYLARLYAADLDPRPHHVYRVMPPDAARAYADSIPKHC